MNPEPEMLQPVLASNLRGEVEKGLRTAILNGMFQPGERLVESVIAEKMGVSRPPVREALSALEREGLVVNVPRRGNFVVSFTAKDIEEVYSLRMILEVEAIHRGIPRFEQANVDQMQRLVDELGKAALSSGEFDDSVNLDFSFHEYLVTMADHSRLYKAWKSMSMQCRLLMGVTSRTYYQSPQAPKMLHQVILDAIAARDVVAAERTVRDHFIDAQQRAMDGRHHLPEETDLGMGKNEKSNELFWEYK